MSNTLKEKLNEFVIRVLEGEKATLQETAILPEMTKILIGLPDDDAPGENS